MKNITLKKSVFVLIIAIVTVFSGSIAVIASNGIEKIQASLNHNITFLVNGSKWVPKDGNGNALSALVYNGSTYVPLRATGEALGAEVNYNANTSIITINSTDGNDGIPYQDINNNSGNTSPGNNNGNSNNGQNKLTSAKATRNDPVPLGQSFKYKDIYESYDKTTAYEAEYQITVKDLAIVSPSNYSNYKVKEESGYDYALLTVQVDLLSGKFTKTDDKEGGFANVYFLPRFVGTESAKYYNIFTLDRTYDSAILTKIENKLAYKKYKIGENVSYSVEGHVLVLLEKGQSNLLYMKDKSGSNSYYFKLN